MSVPLVSTGTTLSQRRWDSALGKLLSAMSGPVAAAAGLAADVFEASGAPAGQSGHRKARLTTRFER